MARLSESLMRRLFRLPWMQRRWARRYRAGNHADVPWTPLARPLGEARFALVTTGGVHLRDDAPFDMSDPRGDPSFRRIRADVDPARLTITHDYYDHRDADRDINVVFPVDVVRDLQADGTLGPAAPYFYSLMGHVEGPHLQTLANDTARRVARELREEGAEVVLLVPA